MRHSLIVAMLLGALLVRSDAAESDPPRSPGLATALGTLKAELDDQALRPGETWMHGLARNAALWEGFLADVERLGDALAADGQAPGRDGEASLDLTLMLVAVAHRKDPQAFTDLLDYYGTAPGNQPPKQVITPRQLDPSHANARYAMAWVMVLLAPRTEKVAWFQDRATQAVEEMRERAALPALERLVAQGLASRRESNRLGRRLAAMRAIDPAWTLGAYGHLAADVADPADPETLARLSEGLRDLLTENPHLTKSAQDLADGASAKYLREIVVKALSHP